MDLVPTAGNKGVANVRYPGSEDTNVPPMARYAKAVDILTILSAYDKAKTNLGSGRPSQLSIMVLRRQCSTAYVTTSYSIPRDIISIDD